MRRERLGDLAVFCACFGAFVLLLGTLWLRVTWDVQWRSVMLVFHR